MTSMMLWEGGRVKGGNPRDGWPRWTDEPIGFGLTDARPIHEYLDDDAPAAVEPTGPTLADDMEWREATRDRPEPSDADLDGWFEEIVRAMPPTGLDDFDMIAPGSIAGHPADLD